MDSVVCEYIAYMSVRGQISAHALRQIIVCRERVRNDYLIVTHGVKHIRSCMSMLMWM